MTENPDSAIQRPVSQIAANDDVGEVVDGPRHPAVTWRYAPDDPVFELEAAAYARVSLDILWDLLRQAELDCADMLEAAEHFPAERQQMLLIYSEARSDLNRMRRWLENGAPWRSDGEGNISVDGRPTEESPSKPAGREI